MDELAEQIRAFLMEFKEIVAKRGIDVIPRSENIEALAEMGLTYNDRKNEILSISVTDYCSGPVPDTDRPGQVWVFGKQIKGANVYIKLKIAQAGEIKIAKCLSFHSAKFPLCFPYKAKKERKK